MNITLTTYDTIDSTNSEALKQAHAGAAEGLCIIAREQTSGRGRHGRVWVSESGAGLFFSIVLRPKLDPRFLPLITLAAGVAVCDTLKEFGLSPDIKWVNDVLIGDRKISGILAETTETALGLAVVVGVGVNIRASNFPPDLAETAISIEEASPQGNGLTRPVPSPEQLSQVLSNYLVHFYNLLKDTDGPERVVEEWRDRSTYFSGKQVRVVLESSAVEGTTAGLEENGALRIKATDGTITIVQAGDVQKLRPSGSGA